MRHNPVALWLWPELKHFDSPRERDKAMWVAVRPFVLWMILGYIVWMLPWFLLTYDKYLLAYLWVRTGVTKLGCVAGPLVVATLKILYIFSYLVLAHALMKQRIYLSLRRQLRDRGIPLCMGCGYDLRGQIEPRCPECGRPIEAELVKMCESLRRGTERSQFQIVSPSREHRGSFMEMVAEFHAAGEDWPHGAYGHDNRALVDFDAYVREVADHSHGLNLPEGWVPCSTFWLLVGDRVVGTVSFRHLLNERLAKEGGHIGYCIRPADRRKGYMTRFLSMVLDEARRMGLPRVLITCAKTNVASASVIGNCGGILEDERPSQLHPGDLTQRYWIDL